MNHLIDMVGRQFGSLLVQRLDFIDSRGERRWSCLCTCGRTSSVRGVCLRSGHTISCGCLGKQRLLDAVTTHGKSKSPAWISWRAMHSRCTNPGDISYPRYGGRGISVCERWTDFANFLADMGERPVGMTLDRYPDNDGNYEPGNCRWATPREQAQNRRARAA